MRNLRIYSILTQMIRIYNKNNKKYKEICKMLNYRDIGKQIKIERIKQDLTQEKLAEMVNISVSHLSGIERGATKLGLSALTGIAEALKISTDTLLCYSVDNEKSKSVLSDNIAGILNDCSNSELIYIEEIVRSAKNALRKILEDAENKNK